MSKQKSRSPTQWMKEERFFFYIFIVLIATFVRSLIVIGLFWHNWARKYYCPNIVTAFGDCLYYLYWMFVYSTFLIPFFDGVIFFFLKLWKFKLSVGRSLVWAIALQVLSVVVTFLLMLLIVEILWKFNIPFKDKHSS